MFRSGFINQVEQVKNLIDRILEVQMDKLKNTFSPVEQVELRALTGLNYERRKLMHFHEREHLIGPLDGLDRHCSCSILSELEFQSPLSWIGFRLVFPIQFQGR